MRFKLLETNVSRAKFDDFVKKNCSEILDVMDMTEQNLYRGMKWGRGRNDPKFAILIPRKNREPKDMPDIAHKILDDMFLEKFGWRARSEGTFASGDPAATAEYGTVYRIYPTNNFKFIWSPTINDLWIRYDKEVGRQLKSYGYVHDPKRVEEFIRKSKLIDEYKDTDITAALASGHEIMIKCTKYAAQFGSD